MGTKAVLVRLLAEKKVREISFFIEVPGLRADHHQLDPFTVYSEKDIKKAEQSKLPVETRFACLGQAQAPRLPARRGESFDPELTTDRLVTGCCAAVLKSIKRSIINIRHSTLDVGRSMFDFQSNPISIRLDARGQSYCGAHINLHEIQCQF
jgi:hypothetical protein